MDLRKTGVDFLCTFNCLAFVTEKQRTYFAERVQILHITHSSLILCFCSYVEHKAFMKFFHLVPSKSSPSAVPILLFFSRLFLVYPSSVYPGGFGPVRVFLSHLMVCAFCGQSNAISCPICCSVGVLVVHVEYGRSNVNFIPLIFVLCHNSSF
jgi:hypothetical protein